MALRFRTMLIALAMIPPALAGGSASGQPARTPAAGLTAAALPGTGAASGGGIPSSPGSGRIRLSESGSTLLYKLFGAWATRYQQLYPNVTITTAPTGSGKGIAYASAGKVDIGASDAFLSSGNLVQDPDLLNIPLAIAAQQVNYNLPGVRPAGTHLKLDGAVLAAMYQGTITSWQDRAIARLNPGVSLPPTKVYPLHRIESSGDTFLFTSYLSTNDSSWNSQIGYGTTVAWPPVANARAETGNGGMVTGCVNQPGCVAYIGISYLNQAQQAGLGEAQLKNHSGGFYLPTGPSMSAAVATFVAATPANETISMVNGPAQNGYPIVNYEYAIVAADQPNPAVARALKAFLHWAITAGNSAGFLGPVRFQPLPAPVVALADAQIGEIR